MWAAMIAVHPDHQRNGIATRIIELAYQQVGHSAFILRHEIRILSLLHLFQAIKDETYLGLMTMNELNVGPRCYILLGIVKS
jgi:GNAT superfamily N-acetyltransferase